MFFDILTFKLLTNSLSGTVLCGIFFEGKWGRAGSGTGGGKKNKKYLPNLTPPKSIKKRMSGDVF